MSSCTMEVNLKGTELFGICSEVTRCTQDLLQVSAVYQLKAKPHPYNQFQLTREACKQSPCKIQS